MIRLVEMRLARDVRTALSLGVDTALRSVAASGSSHLPPAIVLDASVAVSPLTLVLAAAAHVAGLSVLCPPSTASQLPLLQAPAVSSKS